MKEKRSDEEMKWRILESEYLIRRPWLTARRDKVLLPTDKVHDEYYVLHYPSWVNVIAETTGGELILVRQYRHAVGEVLTEICAGVVEEGEEPISAAKRELQEETGYTGGKWSFFMKLAPNASSMDNYSYSFIARGVEKTSDCHLDATEDLNVIILPKAEVFAMLNRGEFIQSLMAAPLWKYFSKYGK